MCSTVSYMHMYFSGYTCVHVHAPFHQGSAAVCARITHTCILYMYTVCTCAFYVVDHQFFHVG